MSASDKVFAFEVWPHPRRDFAKVINHTTAGKAKYSFWLDLRDSWDFPITAMRSRKLGSAQSSPAFTRNAEYRGRPELRCGQRVVAEGEPGVIVGHNDCANLDVLFSEGSRWAGQVMNVHPAYVEVLP